MSANSFPTPYDDVNGVLEALQADIRAILGDTLIGLVVYGSLAQGDFDPQCSDIDLVVVTNGQLPEDAFVALGEMHRRFGESDSRWAGKVEVAYLPQAALQLRAPGPDTYPQIEKGTALVRQPLEDGWAFQRFILREHGIVVSGPDPRRLMDPVDPGDIRHAIAVIAGGWLEQARHDPGWLAWLREPAAWLFVIQTLCRFLYFLQTGALATKLAAIRWAEKALPPRWASLARRSLDRPATIGDGDVGAAVAFVEYVVGQAAA
jgi:hypothetical protein